MRPQISARSPQFLEEASDLMDQKKRQSLGEWVLPSCYQLLGGVGGKLLSQNGWFLGTLVVASLKKRFTISFGKFVEGRCFGSNQTPWNTHVLLHEQNLPSDWLTILGSKNCYQFKEATNTSSLPPLVTPPITRSSQPRMNVNSHATFFRWDWNPHKEQNSTFGCFLSQLFGRILFTNSTRLWWKLMIL